MKLKKIALLGILCCIIVGCKENEEEIAVKNLQESVNKIKLPQKINESTVLTGCYYENRLFTYRYEVPKDTLSLIGKDSLQNRTLDNLKTNLFSQKLVRNLIKAKSNLRYIYTCDTDSIVYTFTPSDLNDLTE
jgi:hypothetical protein